jgi:hypothetical protein
MTTYDAIFIVPSNGKLVKALDWCRENFGQESISVNRMMKHQNQYSTGGRWTREYENNAHSTVKFRFYDPDDATLFKLTWC